jgi:hypothetical protein
MLQQIIAVCNAASACTTYLQQAALVCPHAYAAIYGSGEQQLDAGGIRQAGDHALVHSLAAQALACLQVPDLTAQITAVTCDSGISYLKFKYNMAQTWLADAAGAQQGAP